MMRRRVLQNRANGDGTADPRARLPSEVYRWPGAMRLASIVVSLPLMASTSVVDVDVEVRWIGQAGVCGVGSAGLGSR